MPIRKEGSVTRLIDKELTRSFQVAFKKLKLEKRVKHAELHKKLKVPYSSLWHWDNGKCMPRVGDLVQLANYFNVTTDRILGLE